MSDPVTVVLPAYRAERFIGRAVRSVLAQTRAADEIVIASDDGVEYAELLRADGTGDPRIRCVFTGGVGTGPARARNAGLAAASSPVIATLDADDTLSPRALEQLVPPALRHGAAFSPSRVIDDATGAELESFDRILPGGPLALEDVLTSQIHTFAGIVFDRRRVRATWPEWIERWEDVYFFVRGFDDVDAIHRSAEPLYDYHRRAGSICNRPETGAEYLEWADRLATRLQAGDSLGLERESSRRIFTRFLRSRHTIEAEFLRALKSGLCQDFRSFIRLRMDLFVELDAAA